MEFARANSTLLAFKKRRLVAMEFARANSTLLAFKKRRLVAD